MVKMCVLGPVSDPPLGRMVGYTRLHLWPVLDPSSRMCAGSPVWLVVPGLHLWAMPDSLRGCALAHPFG